MFRSGSEVKLVPVWINLFSDPSSRVWFRHSCHMTHVYRHHMMCFHTVLPGPPGTWSDRDLERQGPGLPGTRSDRDQDCQGPGAPGTKTTRDLARQGPKLCLKSLQLQQNQNWTESFADSFFWTGSCRILALFFLNLFFCIVLFSFICLSVNKVYSVYCELFHW